MITGDRQRLPSRELLISALLVLVTCAVYWPVRHYDFVNHDDPVYVYENPQVLRGLSAAGVAWAFGRLTGEHTYWHPVTWLSLMLDRQLFGPGAGGFLPGGLANCTADTRVLVEGTAGVWFKVYDGSREKVNRGRIQFGPQYSYVRRNVWSGSTAFSEPSGNDSMVFTSFRYYLP